MDSSPVSTMPLALIWLTILSISGAGKTVGFSNSGNSWVVFFTNTVHLSISCCESICHGGVCFQKYDCWRTQLWPAIRVVCHTDFEQASCNFRELFVPSRCTG